jgi:galactokinase
LLHDADGRSSDDDDAAVSLPARWAHLAPAFRERYGSSPTLLVRAPGRVNLIGEHTDYNGLPVLPVALQREVVLLLAPRADARVRVANVDDAYGERDFPVSARPSAGPPGDWGNYLAAPVRHLAEAHEGLVGFDAVLDSDVPMAAGLSSSAALVVAVGLAMSTINDLGLDRASLARAMAGAERFVGVESGGMDQAISLGARAGHATRIDFEPLRWKHVPIPGEWRFLVAHTLVRAEKSAGARDAYNLRTRECRAALETVRRALDEKDDIGYAALMARHRVATLVESAAGALDDVHFRRFRHVVTEAGRVLDAETALLAGNPVAFGALMGASHLSLRNDFEVSSRELDRLVALAQDAGAYGARLTGAGFGGCIVALTDEAHAEELLEQLDRGYYATRSDVPPRDQRLFIVRPADGASAEEPR